MGGRKKKRIVRRRKTLPKKFDCPRCGKHGTLLVSVKKKTVHCICGLSEKDFDLSKEFPIWWKDIDFYCAVLDTYYSR